MKTGFSTLKIVTVMIAVTFLLFGCGEETSIVQESSDIPTTLTVLRNDDGGLLIRSDDGQVYDLDIIEKLLDGELPGVKIQLLRASSQKIQAAPTRYPASEYMTDVTPVSDGVRVSLTWLGFQVGLDPVGAGALATFTITEYQRISGKSWPYNKRSHQSLANEIQFHCFLIFTPFWQRAFPINAGFDENYWG